MDEKNTNECVLLLHGLGRTRFSMNAIARNLEKQGYTTLNCGYPSTRQNIQQLVKGYVAQAVTECKRRNAVKIHVVTHSLGGILIRAYLQNNSLPKGSRIVMLSPPNHGSEIADFIKKIRLFQWILGPSVRQLGTDPESIPNRLKPIPYQTGIITGNVSSDPWFTGLIQGAHDGKVSVASARLDGMRDFLVVPSGHTFIMQSRSTIHQILAFLKLGRFVYQ